MALFNDLNAEADSKEPPKSKAEEPGWFEPGSKSEAFTRGLSNSATFGLAPRISAGLRSISPVQLEPNPGGILPVTLGKNQDLGNFAGLLKEYLAANRAAEAAQPGASLAGAAGPAVIQALATGGGSLARQGAINAAMGAANAAGSSEKQGLGLAGDIAKGAALSGALATAPAAAVKVGSRAAQTYTRNATTDTLEHLIKNKPAGWKQQLEKIIGDSDANLRNEGTNVVQEARHMLSTLKSKELKPSDIPTLVKPAVETFRPSWTQIAKDAGKTVKDATVGAAMGTGLNYATGGNIDPFTAAAGGALFGGSRALSDVGGEFTKRVATNIGTSELPEKLMELGASKGVGAVNQLFSQAAAKDTAQVVNEPTSPFSKLTDYIAQAQTATNPRVQQAAEQAQAAADNTEDPDAKRKAAMILQQTPDGRAVGNSSSPYRDLNLEAE